jgi:hypothetical protein
MTWIKGGPLYEISFLLSNSENKKERLEFIFDTMNKFEFIIEIQNNTYDLVMRQREFIEFQKTPKGEVNTIDLDFQLYLKERRKGRLIIEELSRDFLKFNFIFYGSKFDASEWELKGLNSEVKKELELFFEDSFSNYNPIIGSIGYEVDILEFINTDETYPHKSYRKENLDLEQIKKDFYESKEFEKVYINSKFLNGNEKEILKLKK